MVLQRNTRLKIWGWASPYEQINISFLNKEYNIRADVKGDWQLYLPPQKPGGPYNMQIHANNTIYIHNIYIGDIWVCSGQSNMELTMSRLRYKYPKEIAESDNPYIRQFLVPDIYNFISAQKDIPNGRWTPANSNTIQDFSAVAYFFAKELYNRYKIPIGIINAALGGSPAEAWMSKDALQNFPSYIAEAEKFKNDTLIKNIESQNAQAINTWYKKLNASDRGIQENWKSPATNISQWKTFPVPGYTNTSAGASWFRKEIFVPASMTGKTALLELGRIIDADSVFINGIFAGTTSYQYPPRRYELTDSLLKPGKNVLVVRIVTNTGKGGFVPDKKYNISTGNDTIDLQGEWYYQTGCETEPAPAQTFIRWKPTGLYNAMIAPLTSFAIKGVIWYQGEANTQKPQEYRLLLENLIKDWRTKWRQGDFPFLYAQLPNFMAAANIPQESHWAALRQQQLRILEIPNTGMAVTIDLGAWNDIHPENKKDVGLRLSMQARKIAYHENITAGGPIYQSVAEKNGKMVVSFSNTGAGLIAKNGDTLKYFAIADKNKKFVWANAIIKGDKVFVSNHKIAHPVYVRYAWADNPEGANLYNKEGFPASPFEAHCKIKE